MDVLAEILLDGDHEPVGLKVQANDKANAKYFCRTFPVAYQRRGGTARVKNGTIVLKAPRGKPLRLWVPEGLAEPIANFLRRRRSLVASAFEHFSPGFTIRRKNDNREPPRSVQIEMVC